MFPDQGWQGANAYPGVPSLSAMWNGGGAGWNFGGQAAWGGKNIGGIPVFCLECVVPDKPKEQKTDSEGYKKVEKGLKVNIEKQAGKKMSKYGGLQDERGRSNRFESLADDTESIADKTECIHWRAPAEL